MSRIGCHLLPVGLLLLGAVLLFAAPVPDVPDRRPPHQVEAAQQLLARLKKEAAAPQVDVDALWKLWQRMRLEHGGSPECLAAAAVMSRAPSPLDKLDRNQIPAEDRLPWLPKEVVAVLGEHRGRHWGEVSDVHVTPDGKLILSANVDGFRIWDAATLHEKLFLPGSCSAALSPDGNTLAVGRSTGVIHLYDRNGTRLKERMVLRCDRFPGRAAEEDKRDDEVLKDRLKTKEFEAIPLEELAFGTDGKTLIARTHAATIQVWDISGKAAVDRAVLDAHVLNEHYLGDGLGDSVALLGGDLLLAIRPREDWRLWELKGGRPRKRCLLPGICRPWALSRDGKTFASAVRGNPAIQLWDVSGQEPKRLRGLEGHRQCLTRLAFSPDGKLLASVALDGTLRVWPVSEGARKELRLRGRQTYLAFQLQEEDGQPAIVAANSDRLAFFPDGKSLVVVGEDGRLRRWDIATGRERFEPRGHTGRVNDVAFSPDGKTLASTADDRTLRLWDLTGARPKERAIMRGRSSGTELAFSPEGHLLATLHFKGGGPGSTQGTVRLWDTAGAEARELSAFRAHSAHEYGLAFSPHGRTLITTGGDEREPGSGLLNSVPVVRLWDVKGRTATERAVIRPELSKEDGSADATDKGAISPDGKLLCFTIRRRLRLWSLGKPPFKEWAALGTENMEIESAAFAPDGKTLAAGSTDRDDRDKPCIGRVRLWDLTGAKPKVRAVFKCPPCYSVCQIAFTPDGKYLAGLTWGERESLALWDVSTGKVIKEIRFPRLPNIALAPDGRHLATANPNGSIYILRLTDLFRKPAR